MVKGLRTRTVEFKNSLRIQSCPLLDEAVPPASKCPDLCPLHEESPGSILLGLLSTLTWGSRNKARLHIIPASSKKKIPWNWFGKTSVI